MSRNFNFVGLPYRVVFGAGSIAQLVPEIERLGAKRALLIATPQQKDHLEQVKAALGERCAGVYDRALMHVPIETAREARENSLIATARPMSVPGASEILSP